MRLASGPPATRLRVDPSRTGDVMHAVATAFLIAIVTLAASSGAAQSAYCTESRVIRNMIFDRPGHCFSPVAGRELFGNSD